MSAEKPEVGDVWEHKSINEKVYIVNRDSGTIDFMNNDQIPTVEWENEYEFVLQYKYFGKSKASIKDLFEVE